MLIFILIKLLLALLLMVSFFRSFICIASSSSAIALAYWTEAFAPTSTKQHISFSYPFQPHSRKNFIKDGRKRKDKCKTDNNVIIFIHNTILHNEYYSLSLRTRTWLCTHTSFLFREKIEWCLWGESKADTQKSVLYCAGTSSGLVPTLPFKKHLNKIRNWLENEILNRPFYCIECVFHTYNSIHSP